MRSEGFPFIVWGFGGWTLVRLQLLVASSWRRRRIVVAPLIPCLWGKLQNLSFLQVIKQVLMSFCVAGVVLCDIPTCLIPCRKSQNWRTSRTKHSFCCAYVAVSMGEATKPQSLLLLWRRRVSGGSCKTSVSSRVSACPLASLCQLCSTKSYWECFAQAL